MKKKRLLGMAGALFIALAGVSCGSSSSSGGGGDSGTDSGEIATTAGQVFPADLSVASPFEQSTASASVSKFKSKAIGNYEAERTAVRDMLAGTQVSDCGFDISFFDTVSTTVCYGPVVNYANYPNTGETGSLPPFDLGIWGEMEADSEACAAAKLNELIANAGKIVDSVVKMNASAACMMNVSSLDIPDPGEVVDLKGGLAEAISSNNISGVDVTTASIDRDAADVAGFPAYNFGITGALSQQASQYEMWVKMRHIPQNADNTLYKGKLSYAFTVPSTEGAMECQQAGISTTVRTGAILYEKTSATSMSYRMQTALNCGFTSGTLEEHVPDYFTDSYDLDPAVTFGNLSPYGWVHDFNYSRFNLNPENGTGTFAYAWQAGSGDGNTRVFNATLSENAATSLNSGCAYYGYGPDMASSSSIGSISGMICNWTGPGGMSTHAQQLAQNVLAQRQCMDEDATTGLYASVPVGSTDTDRALRIRYAPVDDCDYPGGTFTYSTTAGDMTNDVPIATWAFPNNLVAVPAFTLPSIPGDVY